MLESSAVLISKWARSRCCRRVPSNSVTGFSLISIFEFPLSSLLVFAPVSPYPVLDLSVDRRNTSVSMFLPRLSIAQSLGWTPTNRSSFSPLALARAQFLQKYLSSIVAFLPTFSTPIYHLSFVVQVSICSAYQHSPPTKHFAFLMAYTNASAQPGHRLALAAVEINSIHGHHLVVQSVSRSWSMHSQSSMITTPMALHLAAWDGVS